MQNFDPRDNRKNNFKSDSGKSFLYDFDNDFEFESEKPASSGMRQRSSAGSRNRVEQRGGGNVERRGGSVERRGGSTKNSAKNIPGNIRRNLSKKRKTSAAAGTSKIRKRRTPVFGGKGKLIILLLLVLLLVFIIVRCSASDKDKAPSEPTNTEPEVTGVVYNDDGSFTLKEPEVILKQRTQVNYDELYGTLVPYNGRVEHIFFHPVVCYPELAFDGDDKANGIDDWMVTVNEYNKILQNLYDKGYIIVNMNDVWSEYTDESGNTRMKQETLMLPEGKKPLIISYDDTNYYQYMLTNGFTHKLIIGDDGEIWSYGLDPDGKTVISQDLDAITILDKFVEEHPDFSYYGAKGCLALTGYEGILGYRTNTDAENTSPEFEANRQKEIEAVKPIIKALKETGWYFGSHSWGHINLSGASYNGVVQDTERWLNEVGSLIGETSLYFYPHGARPDGDDVSQTGPAFKYLHEQGFRVFASVGIESFSAPKSDISAIICDRLHPDGTTLRWARDRYMHFYDAKDILEVDVRPDRGYDFG